MNPPSRQDLIRKIESDLSPRGIRRRKRRWISNGLFWLFLVRVLGACKRFLDASLAVVLLTLLSPLLLLLFVAAMKKGRALQHIPRLGRWATEFHQFRFN